MIGFIALIAFLVTAFTPVPNLLSSWIGRPPRLEAAEAIVVLGAGGVRGDGTLSDSSLQHTVHAIRLYRRGLAPLLLFSGSPGLGACSEATARTQLARELGVPTEAVLIEETAHTTREEAMKIGVVLRGRGIQRIVLVAHWEGMRRAEAVFVQAAMKVLPAPDHVRGPSDTPEGRLETMRLVMQETVAWYYYRIAGYL